MSIRSLLVLAGGVLLISCGGSKTEIAASTQSLPRSDVAPRFFVDEIGAAPTPAIDKEISVLSAGPLVAGGWAADSAGGPVGGVEIAVDGKPYPATYGIERPDVAAALKDPSYNRFGFQFSIPASQFSNGSHTLTVRIINKDRSGYFETPAFHFRIQ